MIRTARSQQCNPARFNRPKPAEWQRSPQPAGSFGCMKNSAISSTRSRRMPSRCSTARGCSVGSNSTNGRCPTGRGVHPRLEIQRGNRIRKMVAEPTEHRRLGLPPLRIPQLHGPLETDFAQRRPNEPRKGLFLAEHRNLQTASQEVMLSPGDIENADLRSQLGPLPVAGGKPIVRGRSIGAPNPRGLRMLLPTCSASESIHRWGMPFSAVANKGN